MRYLRIREAAGVFFWESSADGVSWDPFAQALAPFDVSAIEIGIGAWASQNQSVADTIKLDNINVLP